MREKGARQKSKVAGEPLGLKTEPNTESKTKKQGDEYL